MRRGIKRGLIGIVAGAMIFASVLGADAMTTQAAVVQPGGIGSVAILSATIGGDNVVINAVASEMPASDDGQFHLFAERVYQIDPAGAPIASLPIGPAATFVVPLGYNTVNNRLYDKFQIAVLQGGKYVPVSSAHYITNPEALAGGSNGFVNNGKKGLILDSAKIGNGNTEVQQLGVQQGAYNINLEDVIGGNGAIQYNYNGKTYAFDSVSMGMYDHVVRVTTSQGIGLTMVLLNPRAKGEEFMISPSSRGGRCSYYMMNTSEEKGLEYLEAVVSFLARRYNGRNGCGQVDNWVIGNEVNAKSVWNYSSIHDEMQYAQLYTDELRVCYNAIKSNHANARVCASLDQNWCKVQNVASYYSARSMLEAINACACSQGNFDWALAEHPYNYPLTWTSFWTPQSATAASMISHTIDTGYLSMENIEQLTDYMAQPAMRNTKGEVRPILLTEVGYSSTQGEEAQAAAIVYAYQRTMTNQHLKMIIFNRQTDVAAEMKQGLSVGLSRPDGSHKLAFEFFQKMSSGEAGGYIQRAAAFMGIGDWAAAMYAR
ncbi:MAG: hypothetical protein IKO80_08985 [Lachnospiraceae bacterium]|nr:hypothetical protein [Lachnospiraceae bacterium]